MAGRRPPIRAYRPDAPAAVRRRTSIVSRVVRTVREHRLIEPGDRILAAISGGKDSLALLDVLAHLRGRRDFDFDLEVVHVRTLDICRDCGQCAALERLVGEMGVPWHGHDVRFTVDEEGAHRLLNCFWCSRARRKVIFETAEAVGASKVAMGHHRDDLADTAMLNLLIHGECSTMTPRQPLFGGFLTLIRPLADVSENRCAELTRLAGYPIADCRCPAEETNPRARIHQLLDQASTLVPRARMNLVRAVLAVTPEHRDGRLDDSDPDLADTHLRCSADD